MITLLSSLTTFQKCKRKNFSVLVQSLLCKCTLSCHSLIMYHHQYVWCFDTLFTMNYHYIVHNYVKFLFHRQKESSIQMRASCVNRAIITKVHTQTLVHTRGLLDYFEHVMMIYSSSLLESSPYYRRKFAF